MPKLLTAYDNILAACSNHASTVVTLWYEIFLKQM